MTTTAPPTPRKIAYYCMACPEVFYDAKTSNAHHDATGHHQHWEESRSYAARQGVPIPKLVHCDTLDQRADFAAASIRQAVVEKDGEDLLAEWFNPGFLITTADIINELRAEVARLSQDGGPTPRKWQVGDVVQIDPAHDERFGACFMTITEPKSWGAQGFVKVPAEGEAYYRYPTEAMVYVGRAEWAPADESGSAPTTGATPP